MPRFEPYTAIGIKRVPCVRCGQQGHANWNICADKVGNRAQFRALCKDCDVELNEMVMRWAFGNLYEVEWKLKRYRALVSLDDTEGAEHG